MSISVIDNMKKIIKESRSIKDLRGLIARSVYLSGIEYDSVKKDKIKILILNIPCEGFGDIIFAKKLSQYLEKWYNAKVTIATTKKDSFIKIGANPKNIVELINKSKPYEKDCLHFHKVSFKKKLPKQDLIFAAPIPVDLSPDLLDIQTLIPYATQFNTFTFSEYNDEMNKGFTFNTGIGQEKGRERDGILLTDVPKFTKRPKELTNPYSLVYIASGERDADDCILAFVEMVSKKYHTKHPNFDIVAPQGLLERVNSIRSQFVKKIKKYYPRIVVKYKDVDDENVETFIFNEGKQGDNTLTLRFDIFPVPNEKMLHLMSQSVNDILLTGDQSITDAFSCCSNKNIFYQIVPWKENFAHWLASEMPNKYLKSVKTSCGSLKAVTYKGNYSKFIQKWDFRKKSKPILDAMVTSIVLTKNNKDIKKIVNIIDDNDSVTQIKHDLKDILHSPVRRRSKTPTMTPAEYLSRYVSRRRSKTPTRRRSKSSTKRRIRSPSKVSRKRKTSCKGKEKSECKLNDGCRWVQYTTKKGTAVRYCRINKNKTSSNKRRNSCKIKKKTECKNSKNCLWIEYTTKKGTEVKYCRSKRR